MSLEADDEDNEALPPLPDCGQRISLESHRHRDKLWTRMIGFKPAEYLVLDKPTEADAAGRTVTLEVDDALVIRFLKDGSVFGFRATVLSTVSFPYKLLFVSFPAEAARHSLRSSPRLQCYLPCSGRVGTREFTRGFVPDFSATGCQLRVPLDFPANQDEPGAKNVTLNMQLPGEAEPATAHGQVLEWQTKPRYHLLRVKFDEPQMRLFEQISVYTTELD